MTVPFCSWERKQEEYGAGVTIHVSQMSATFMRNDMDRRGCIEGAHRVHELWPTPAGWWNMFDVMRRENVSMMVDF